MSNESPIRPPQVAGWLISLFASAQDETLQGDLLEEFSQLASNSEESVARRWYWRQAVKSTVHLFCSAFRIAPYSTAAAITGGFLLWRLLAPLPGKAIFAVLERYRVFDTHFNVYVFFATKGIAIAHVLTSVIVGCLVAFAAKRNGMIAVISLVLVLVALTCVASFVWMARGYALMWNELPWIFLDWFAMLVGAALIRGRTTTSRNPTSLA